MDGPIYLIGVFAMIATALVLLLGIASFGKGGNFSLKNSNKIMRLRLLLQFIAVILFVAYIYLRGQGG